MSVVTTLERPRDFVLVLHLISCFVFLDDERMADRGFQIKEELMLRYCSLSVRPGARVKAQMTAGEYKRAKDVANLRIHVALPSTELKPTKFSRVFYPSQCCTMPVMLFVLVFLFAISNHLLFVQVKIAKNLKCGQKIKRGNFHSHKSQKTLF